MPKRATSGVSPVPYYTRLTTAGTHHAMRHARRETHLWVCRCRAPWSFQRVAAAPPPAAATEATVVRAFRSHDRTPVVPTGRGRWADE